MKDAINSLLLTALDSVANAADEGAVEEIRIKVLGKKGELTQILKKLGTLSAEERPQMGQLANEVRAKIETAIAEKSEQLK